jgi:hypothetical protein
MNALADAHPHRPVIVFPFLAWLVARGLPEPRMG